MLKSNKHLHDGYCFETDLWFGYDLWTPGEWSKLLKQRWWWIWVRSQTRTSTQRNGSTQRVRVGTLRSHWISTSSIWRWNSRWFPRKSPLLSRTKAPLLSSAFLAPLVTSSACAMMPFLSVLLSPPSSKSSRRFSSPPSSQFIYIHAAIPLYVKQNYDLGRKFWDRIACFWFSFAFVHSISFL